MTLSDHNGKKSSISTRRGDGGETSLLFGRRVPKTHIQIECVGACDELSAVIGLARCKGVDGGLEGVQRDLITIMGEVASEDAERLADSALSVLGDDRLAWLDGEAAALEDRLTLARGWSLAGANEAAAALDFARTVARRAERALWRVTESGVTVRPLVASYLNRLSDYLWLLARQEEQRAG